MANWWVLYVYSRSANPHLGVIIQIPNYLSDWYEQEDGRGKDLVKPYLSDAKKFVIGE